MISQISQFIQSVRAIALALMVVVVLFVNATPALAISSSPSAPSDGEAPLNNIYDKAERALENEPRSMNEVQDEAGKGLNEVQGDADLDKMNHDGNSPEATTAKEKVEDALDNLFNR
ncbi:MAG: hypothetical protein KME20_19175 [Kaiparowitsia implicata GSE-PSE-MK54-09C]|jgi:hypothetical protein|nr:hypothetical protein [Kaiparowitsia implicata GSE-PSE-MK54-09C]